MIEKMSKGSNKAAPPLYKRSIFSKLTTLAGVAQLVERDLPKVDVEGSKPFSRSKIEGSLWGSFYFIFGMGFEPEKRVRQNPVMHEVRKTDFELDTSTASASPKGLIATLRQQGIL